MPSCPGRLSRSKNEVKTMAQAFFGGVHPHDMKAATNEKAIEQLAPPAVVVIPMSMHFWRALHAPGQGRGTT